MKTLLVLNDAPYGSERTYNGARLGGALARQEGSAAADLIAGAHRSSLDELTQWTAWADKLLVF